MQVLLLGYLAVVGDDGLEMPVPSARLVRAVLEVLALRAGAVVQAWELIDAVWGDDPPVRADKGLQTYIGALRRALGVESIETVGTGYRLRVDEDQVDINQFEEHVRDGLNQVKGHQFDLAVASLSAASRLWRGEPLEELVDSSAGMAVRARLSELRGVAEEGLFEARLGLGEHVAVLADLEAAVRAEPFRERRWALLMLALYRSGRQGEALAAFDRLERLLSDNRLSPGDEIRDLKEAVSARDPNLVLPVDAGQAVTRPEGWLERPLAMNSFVGRSEDVIEILKLLGNRRLVTLTGPGGVGKTRLAVEVVAEIDEPVDGAFFVDLADEPGSSDAAAKFVAALGQTPTPSISADMKLLAEFVANRDLLLVVDNCEHVVGATAGLIERLLAASKRLRVLATSRELLRVRGEVVWTVSPLALPDPDDRVELLAQCDSVQLFVDRAVDADPRFVLNEKSTRSIARIVARLDGLPLAIELAAGRVRIMHLADLAASLSRRLSLLRGGVRTAAPRQQTLESTITWSYELLTPAQQAVFRRLSIFDESFTVEDARAVGLDDIDGADVAVIIAELADCSLLALADLDEEGQSRYRMLDTTSIYCRGLWTEGERYGLIKVHYRMPLRVDPEIERAIRFAAKTQRGTERLMFSIPVAMTLESRSRKTGEDRGLRGPPAATGSGALPARSRRLRTRRARGTGT
jgi:predicted ATPase/DNA-binding SARP family transcriptional activator